MNSNFWYHPTKKRKKKKNPIKHIKIKPQCYYPKKEQKKKHKKKGSYN